jgi:hypothetical protein
MKIIAKREPLPDQCGQSRELRRSACCFTLRELLNEVGRTSDGRDTYRHLVMNYQGRAEQDPRTADAK